MFPLFDTVLGRILGFIPRAMLCLALASAAIGHGATPLVPGTFGVCPREAEPLLQYVVQNRTQLGLNRIKPDAETAKAVTLYGGSPEDANLAWIAAAAYKYEWSQFHHSEIVRIRAFALLDALAELHPTGDWDDGGLNAFFGLHSFSWAVLEWIETGDVDPERTERWIDAVRAAADQAMLGMHYGPYRPSALTGQYANPEFYYLSGLAAAWKLSGEERYRLEAEAALARYEDWLYPGGGMPYFLRSQPEHGYQQMVVKATALYWDLTGDEKAYAMLERMAPYFPNTMHRSGLLTDAEEPHLKHNPAANLKPSVPLMLANILQDGANRAIAEKAIPVQADIIDQKKPSFPSGKFNWYNYQSATFAATALRLIEKYPLPPAEELAARRIFQDQSFNGIRSHWDDVTAAVGVRQMNDSLAGWYRADPEEPRWPLNAAVDGVYFEILQTWRENLRGNGPGYQNVYRTIDWDPTTYHLNTEGFAAVSAFSRLCKAYWGRMPLLTGARFGAAEVSEWSTIQHWAVWRDCLIGLSALQCNADGGDSEGQDQARIRWRLAPQGRRLQHHEQSEQRWHMDWGGLNLELTRLEQQGGFQFAEDRSQKAPYSDWSPVLAKSGAWSAGDFVYVASVARPTGAEGEVKVHALPYGAAALMLEPGAQSGFLWVVNLTRHWHQYLWDVPAGLQAEPIKWSNKRLPPIPDGEPASGGLGGGESIVWCLTSDTPMAPDAILDALRRGQSRRHQSR